jgi:hypothetical protein
MCVECWSHQGTETKNYKKKCIRLAAGRKVCEDEQGKIKEQKRWHTHGRRRYGLYLSLDSLVYKLASPRMVFSECNPFPLGVSLGRPQGD